MNPKKKSTSFFAITGLAFLAVFVAILAVLNGSQIEELNNKQKRQFRDTMIWTASSYRIELLKYSRLAEKRASVEELDQQYKLLIHSSSLLKSGEIGEIVEEADTVSDELDKSLKYLPEIHALIISGDSTKNEKGRLLLEWLIEKSGEINAIIAQYSGAIKTDSRSQISEHSSVITSLSMIIMAIGGVIFIISIYKWRETNREAESFEKDLEKINEKVISSELLFKEAASDNAEILHNVAIYANYLDATATSGEPRILNAIKNIKNTIDQAIEINRTRTGTVHQDFYEIEEREIIDIIKDFSRSEKIDCDLSVDYSRTRSGSDSVSIDLKKSRIILMTMLDFFRKHGSTEKISIQIEFNDDLRHIIIYMECPLSDISGKRLDSLFEKIGFENDSWKEDISLQPAIARELARSMDGNLDFYWDNEEVVISLPYKKVHKNSVEKPVAQKVAIFNLKDTILFDHFREYCGDDVKFYYEPDEDRLKESIIRYNADIVLVEHPVSPLMPSLSEVENVEIVPVISREMDLQKSCLSKERLKPITLPVDKSLLRARLSLD